MRNTYSVTANKLVATISLSANAILSYNDTSSSKAICENHCTTSLFYSIGVLEGSAKEFITFNISTSNSETVTVTTEITQAQVDKSVSIYISINNFGIETETKISNDSSNDSSVGRISSTQLLTIISLLLLQKNIYQSKINC